MSTREHLQVRYGMDVPDVTSFDAIDFELLADVAGHRLADARAVDVLAWGALTFGDSMAVTSSMADTVVAHLASRVLPGIAVVFVDTGLHFPETLATRAGAQATLPIQVIDARPELSLAEQARRFGPQLWTRDPDRCCALRKVQPLDAALRPFRAWVSGLRGDESAQRVGTPVVQWDAKREMVKLNPIARWSRDEVDAYRDRHPVLKNALLDQGFRSVGCAPCTRRTSVDEHERAGRWAGLAKTECGIHS